MVFMNDIVTLSNIGKGLDRFARFSAVFGFGASGCKDVTVPKIDELLLGYSMPEVRLP